MIKLITKQLKLSDVFEYASLRELQAYCEGIPIICFDSETTGYDAHSDDFISVQIGNKDVQYVIDCNTIDIKEIKPILESGKQVMFHNSLFDLRFLLKHGIDVKNIYDTFLAELVLSTGYEHKDPKHAYYKGTSLKYLAKKYCSQDLDKEVRGQIHWRGLDEAVIRYGAKDIAYLEDIRDKQLVQIHRWKLENLLELENKVARVFSIMSFNGITLDKEKWLKVADITEQEVKALVKELDAIVLNEPLLSKLIPKAIQQNLFGFEERLLSINWGSPLQKLEIVKALGLPMESVGYRDLQKNRKQYKLIEKLIEYSKQDKLATAFGREFLKFINKDTDRVHMSIWPILSTGRIAVSEPNLNQIPSRGDLAKEIRSAFIPKQGYKIVGGDFSNFELRIIAEFSDDPLWIKVFKEDGDLHSELCAMTFNIPLSDVKKPFPPKPSITYRDVQKTVDFGLTKAGPSKIPEYR